MKSTDHQAHPACAGLLAKWLKCLLLPALLLMYASPVSAANSIAVLENVSDFNVEMDFSPDGQMLAVTELSGLRVYDLASGAIVFETKFEESSSDVAFGADGQHVVVGFGEAGGAIIDISDLKEPVKRRLDGKWDQLSISQDGKLVTAWYRWSSEHDVLAASWEGVEFPPYDYSQHFPSIIFDQKGNTNLHLRQLAFSFADQNLFMVDGQTAATSGPASTAFVIYNRPATKDNLVGYFDITKSKNIRFLTLKDVEEPRLVDFRETSLGPRALVWLVEGSRERLAGYDPQTDTVHFSLDVPAGQYERFSGAAISSDGLRVAVLRKDHAVEIFATDDAPEPEKLISKTDKTKQPELALTQGHGDQISAIAISPDGTLLATAGADDRTHIWDAANGRQLRSIAEGDLTWQIAFSPDSKFILSVGDGVNIWRIADGKRIYTLPHSATQWADYLPEGGKIIACGTADCSIGTPDEFLDFQTRTIERPDKWNWANSWRGTVSSNGKFAAQLMVDGKILCVDINSGTTKIIGPLPNAKTIALGDDALGIIGQSDGSLLLFDARTGKVGEQISGSTDETLEVSALEKDRFLVVTDGAVGAGFDFVDTPPTRRVFDARDKAFTENLPEPHSDMPLGSAGPSAYSSKTGRLVTVSQNIWKNRQRIDEWSLLDNRHLQSISANALAPRSIAFSADDSRLFISGKNTFATWDLRSGKVAGVEQSALGATKHPTKSGVFYRGLGDGRLGKLYFANQLRGEREIKWQKPEAWYGTLSNEGVSNGKDLLLYDTHADGVYAAIFDLDAIDHGEDGAKSVVELEGGQQHDFPDYILSPDSQIIVGSALKRVVAYDAKTGKQLWEVFLNENDYHIRDIAFSPDGTKIFIYKSAGQLGITVLETVTGRIVKQPTGEHLLAIHNSHVARLLSVSSTAFTLEDDGNSDAYTTATLGISSRFAYFDPQSGSILIVGYDSRNLLWKPGEDGKVFVLPANLTDRSAIAFSSDGSLLATIETSGLVSIWRTKDGQRLAYLSTMRDGQWAVIKEDGRYDASDPGDFPSLGWVMPDRPDRVVPLELFFREFFEPGLLPRLINAENFTPVPDLQDINRLQPEVRIAAVDLDPAEPDTASVEVSVTETEDEGGSSGVSAVKLFLDGQLVGQRVFKDDDEGPSRNIRFDKILLPTGERDHVSFSAYAFNSDGVKSETVHTDFSMSEKEQTASKPSAYVISIGVDRYDNAAWNLNYAAADAALSADEIAKRLVLSDQYAKVVPITLASTKASEKREATKGQVEAVLRILGGQTTDRTLLSGIANAEFLSRARPDDFVYLFFAGHGLAGHDGVFYLFPSDFDQTGSRREITPALLERALDSVSLSDLFLNIQAREMTVVIDACNSAASIESGGFKPGPMGSRGLGQLAYDKGIQVLTASQAEGAALESSVIRHGALSYALFREGLETGKADRAPADRRVSISELLTFAKDRVPRLHEELISNTFTPIVRGSMSFSFVTGDEEEEETHPARYLQQPSLFDFSNRRHAKPIYLPLD